MAHLVAELADLYNWIRRHYTLFSHLFPAHFVLCYITLPVSVDNLLTSTTLERIFRVLMVYLLLLWLISMGEKNMCITVPQSCCWRKCFLFVCLFLFVCFLLVCLFLLFVCLFVCFYCLFVCFYCLFVCFPRPQSQLRASYFQWHYSPGGIGGWASLGQSPVAWSKWRLSVGGFETVSSS